MLDRIARVLASVVMGAIGLGGLFMASNADDGGIYSAGLLIFALALGYIFWQVKRHFDALDRARHDHRRGGDHGTSAKA